MNNYLRTYDNIWKIANSQWDNYTTGCLLNYTYFKEYYKIIAIDLSKQQVPDVALKAMQKISFTGNLDGQATMFFIIEEEKETNCMFLSCHVRVSEWNHTL